MKRSVKTNPSITKFFKTGADRNNNVRDGVTPDSSNTDNSKNTDSNSTNNDSIEE